MTESKFGIGDHVCVMIGDSQERGLVGHVEYSSGGLECISIGGGSYRWFKTEQLERIANPAPAAPTWQLVDMKLLMPQSASSASEPIAYTGWLSVSEVFAKIGEQAEHAEQGKYETSPIFGTALEAALNSASSTGAIPRSMVRDEHGRTESCASHAEMIDLTRAGRTANKMEEALAKTQAELRDARDAVADLTARVRKAERR